MPRAVLTTKVVPTYDDLPEERYHFPRAYLNQVRQAVGDFVVYYEPRRTSGKLSSRGGWQGYFAVARVVSAEPDPAPANPRRRDHTAAPAVSELAPGECVQGVMSGLEGLSRRNFVRFRLHDFVGSGSRSTAYCRSKKRSGRQND